jgi:hypothetical protein
MSKHMVIAPGELIDRAWYERMYAVRFMQPVTFSVFDLDTPEPLCAMPTMTHTATLRRYMHPGWKVFLGFYVDDRIFPDLPVGYVMPGWVHGVQLESCNWGTWRHLPHEHVWELVNVGSTDDQHRIRVSCEVIRERPDIVAEHIARMQVRPLPPEAANGCPPRPEPDWQPFTLDELAAILRGDDDDPFA